MVSIPQKWKKWVLDNLLLGVEVSHIANTLSSHGFTADQIRTVMGNNLPIDFVLPRDAHFYSMIANPRLVREINETKAQFLENEKAQVIRIYNFLYPEQCDELVRLTKSKLKPSTVTTGADHNAYRTSYTCDLELLNNDFVNRVNQHIVNVLGVGIGENEVIQAQHYSVGQEFKKHTDYFEPGTSEYQHFGRDQGQRTWTFMIYLNDVISGGETEFIHLGIKQKPVKGLALVWNNLNPDGTPNPNTLHHAHPVIEGEKVVITKWFRDLL